MARLAHALGVILPPDASPQNSREWRIWGPHVGQRPALRNRSPCPVSYPALHPPNHCPFAPPNAPRSIAGTFSNGHVFALLDPKLPGNDHGMNIPAFRSPE